MRTCITLACVLLVIWASGMAWADIGPEGGVGITDEPDSLDIPETKVDPQCPTTWTSSHQDRFDLYATDEYNYWIDLDVDLLIDERFELHPDTLLNPVLDSEARLMLDAMDWEFDNRFDWQDTDLGLLFQNSHANLPEFPYDPNGGAFHFLLFQICANEDVPIEERNHIDVYLCPSSVPEPDRGYYPCSYADSDEDGSPDPADPEWSWNAMMVEDSHGNTTADTTDWPLKAAQGVCHEFGHACWSSNSKTHGTQYTETLRHDYNELLACAAGYLAKPPFEPLNADVRYAYSILSDYGICYDPNYGSISVEQQRYKLWYIIAAYLGYRFHDESSISASLLSRWARNITDRDGIKRMERTFCGLAEILDDDRDYEWLGYAGPEGYDGGYRLNRVFSEYGIARWMNSPTLSTPSHPSDKPYWFGPDYSPTVSTGQFRKIHDGQWAVNALWEFAIPPEYVLDLDDFNIWTEVPDTSASSVCDSGWVDLERYGMFPYHGCVPPQVDLWGSNYLVFRADTLIYNGSSWTDTLVVEFTWKDSMNPHVELWMSVLTYPVAHDSLFLDRYTSGSVETTFVCSTETSGALVRVPEFRKDCNEAVVVVMTLVSSDYSIDLHPNYGCLRRMTYSDEPRVDLRYSYRFTVAGTHEPGGGCPFVSYLTPEGFLEDNNILARAPAPDGEILDAYLLEEDLTSGEGRYGLRLSENETDHSLFDAIQLIAVDHPTDLDVGILPGGSVGLYSVSALPVACYDSEGRDLLDLVVSGDDRYAVLAAGSQMEVHFPASAGGRGGGGAGTRGTPSHKIDPPGGGGRGQAAPGILDLTDLCYRENVATSILEMPDELVVEDGMVKMVVTAPVEYWVDHMFLVEFSDEPIAVQQCALLEAIHSLDGPCASALEDAGVYAALDPGESIDLAYEAPPVASGFERDFVLVGRGRFTEHSSRSGGDGSAPATVISRASVSPNPFAISTTISLSIPEPGGEVAARVYDMAGRLVRTLAQRRMQPGAQVLHWDGKDDHGQEVASGVYFCEITGHDFDERRKLVLVK